MGGKTLLAGIFIFAVIAACIYIAVELLMSGWVPGYPLSKAERQLVKELKQECHCQVELLHNSRQIDQPGSDSTLRISFYWVTGEGEAKDLIHNIAIKEDTAISRFAHNVAGRLTSVMSYSDSYNSIHVRLAYIFKNKAFSTTNDESGLTFKITDEKIELMDFKRY